MKALKQLSLAAIAAVFTVSCAKEAPIIDSFEKPIDTSSELVSIDAPVDMTFTGITDNEPGTKTVLSGLNINWSPAEKIYLFDGTAPRAFTSTNDVVASSVSFSGSASSAANYYAVYPSGTISGKVISTTIPVIQSATANSFAPKANVAVAYTESNPTGENVLQFKNVGAVVKFQLANDDVRKVKLEAINGEKMSGPVDVTFGEGPSFTSAIVPAEAESCVVLDGGASNLSASTPYYLAVYPNTYTRGFKITLIKADGSFRSFSNTTSNTLGRNDLMDLGTLPEVTSWKTTGATDELTVEDTEASKSSYVSFSDVSLMSAAIYAGQNAKNYSAIQINNTSPNGIVSTTSGGKITKVSVSWNSNTTSGRTLDVYGKNTAYESGADLYSATPATQGALLGSIVYGTSTELDITGDYEYVGIRSHSGAMYLNAVLFTWGDPLVIAPTLPKALVPSTSITNITGTSFSLSGGSMTFDVVSNVPWTVSTNQPSYSSVSVSGNRVTVTFSTLPSGSRNATITVTPAEGEPVQQLFTQNSNVYSVISSKASISAGKYFLGGNKANTFSEATSFYMWLGTVNGTASRLDTTNSSTWDDSINDFDSVTGIAEVELESAGTANVWRIKVGSKYLTALGTSMSLSDSSFDWTFEDMTTPKEGMYFYNSTEGCYVFVNSATATGIRAYGTDQSGTKNQYMGIYLFKEN